MNYCNLFRLKNDCVINCLLYVSNKLYLKTTTLADYLCLYDNFTEYGIEYDELNITARNLGLKLKQIKLIDTIHKINKIWHLCIYYVQNADSYHAVLIKKHKNKFLVYDPANKNKYFNLDELLNLSEIEIFAINKNKQKQVKKINKFRITLNCKMLFFILWPVIISYLAIFPTFFFWKIYFDLWGNTYYLISFIILFLISSFIYLWMQILIKQKYHRLHQIFATKIQIAWNNKQISFKNQSFFTFHPKKIEETCIKNAFNAIQTITLMITSAINLLFLVWLNFFFAIIYIAFILFVLLICCICDFIISTNYKLLNKVNTFFYYFTTSSKFFIIIIFAIIFMFLNKYSLAEIFITFCIIGLITADWKNLATVIWSNYNTKMTNKFTPILNFIKYNINK